MPPRRHLPLRERIAAVCAAHAVRCARCGAAHAVRFCASAPAASVRDADVFRISWVCLAPALVVLRSGRGDSSGAVRDVNAPLSRLGAVSHLFCPFRAPDAGEWRGWVGTVGGMSDSGDGFPPQDSQSGQSEQSWRSGRGGRNRRNRNSPGARGGRSALRSRPAWRGWAVFAACLVVFGFAAWIVWGAAVTHENPVVRAVAGKDTTSLVIAAAATPQTADPSARASAEDFQLLTGNVYETITGRSASNRAVAGLASAWEESEDGLSYTFHIDPAACFSDGTPLTAADVVASLQATISGALPGSEGLSAVSAVSNTDEATLVITLASPDQTLAWRLSGAAGLVWRSGDDGRPVGSGPYTVSSITPGAELILTRAESYWGARGGASGVPASVTLRAYADAATPVSLLSDGRIDAVLPMGEGDDAAVGALSDVDGVETQAMDSTQRTALAFLSAGQTYFSDVAFRQSARRAVDAASVIAGAGLSAQPLSGPVAPCDPGYEEGTDEFGYDPTESAKRFQSSRGNLSFVYRAADAAVAGQVQAAFRAAGWWTFPSELDDDAYAQQVGVERDYNITIVHFDSSRDLAGLLDPDGVTGYSSMEADQLSAALFAATTNSDYEDAAASLARRINEDSAYGWLYVRRPVAAFRSGVTGMPALYSGDRLDLTALHVE